MKYIIDELKQNTLFYSILIWLFIWLISVVLDKYSKYVHIDERNSGLNYLRSKITNEDKMKQIKQKLDTFTDPVPKYFYLDYGIIELMYSIREFQLYSKVIYRDIIELIDQFLKITYYCEQYPHSFNIMQKNLIDLKNNVLNEMQSMVFNVPENNVADYKLSKAIESMQILLNFHLEHLRNKNNMKYAQTGPNTRNKYISRFKEDTYNLKLSKTLNAQLF